MVQDMFDPELYLARFKATNSKTGETKHYSGHYRDVASGSVSMMMLFDLLLGLHNQCNGLLD